MATPAVRKLNTLVSQYSKGIKDQESVIDADLALNEGSRTAAVEGIEARKTSAFGDIEQRASDKGMFFSGMPVHEQSEYVGGTYLPELAKLEQTIATTRNSLLGKKADLRADVYNRALDTREGDIDRRYDYQEARRAERFQARESQKDRQFQARQAASGSASDQGLQYTVLKNDAGGYEVYSKSGSKADLDLAQYVSLNGGSVGDLVSFLSEGDEADRRAAQNYQANIEAGVSPSAAYAQLKKDRPTAFFRGGGF